MLNELLNLAGELLVTSRSETSQLEPDEFERDLARSIELVSGETSFRILGEVLQLDETLELPVDLVIAVYRRILALGGNDALTRLCFAGYLLLHGPRWDDEAIAMRAEVEPAAKAAGILDAPHLGHHPVFFRGEGDRCEGRDL